MRLMFTAHEGYNLKFFPLLGFESWMQGESLWPKTILNGIQLVCKYMNTKIIMLHYITVRTELSFWSSVCHVGGRWVNQFMRGHS